MILLEVTSDSSEDYDTGEKLTFYKTIPTLRECIIVSHRERPIVVHTRGEGDLWTARTAIGSGRVTVTALGAELVVDTVYRGSTLP
jgi:Uma2 family endonuclease